MNGRLRRARGALVVLLLALAGAVAAWQAHPVLALAPLVALGLPAALMVGSTLRHGDPYDVLYRYPSEGPESVGPHE